MANAFSNLSIILAHVWHHRLLTQANSTHLQGEKPLWMHILPNSPDIQVLTMNVDGNYRYWEGFIPFYFIGPPDFSDTVNVLNKATPF